MHFLFNIISTFFPFCKYFWQLANNCFQQINQPNIYKHSMHWPNRHPTIAKSFKWFVSRKITEKKAIRNRLSTLLKAYICLFHIVFVLKLCWSSDLEFSLFGFCRMLPACCRTDMCKSTDKEKNQRSLRNIQSWSS